MRHEHTDDLGTWESATARRSMKPASTPNATSRSEWKADGERKAKDLRIPVTEEQKAVIAEAMKLSGDDMATWARPILLAAAQAVIDAAKKPKKK